MKILRILILAASLVMASGAMAQTVYNSSGSSCGKIESNGTIRNSSGSSVGRFDSDGTIRNSSGSSIGKIDRDGTFRNSSGSSIGRLDSATAQCATALDHTRAGLQASHANGWPPISFSSRFTNGVKKCKNETPANGFVAGVFSLL